jgi:MFS family permease
MGLVDALGALGERQFRLLWAGQTFSNLGSALVPIALAFAVLDLTGSATDLGLVLLASRLPQVLLVLAGGVVGDRLPRRRVMLASDLTPCATQATTALLLASGTARLWQLLALQAAHGAAAAFFDPAATGLVPQTVERSRLQQANALMGLSRSASGILGQVGAGVLVVTAGPAAALTVDAGSFAVSAWSLALLRPAGTVRIGQKETFFAQLAAGWSEFRSRSWLWASVAHLSLLNLVVLAPFFVLGPLVALRSLGGPTAWAAIATAYASGAVTGGLVGLRWRPAGRCWPPPWSWSPWCRWSPALPWPPRCPSWPWPAWVAGSRRACTRCCGAPACNSTCRPRPCPGSAPTAGWGRCCSRRWATPWPARWPPGSASRPPCGWARPGSWSAPGWSWPSPASAGCDASTCLAKPS